MRLAILHHHLNRGGVTQVIANHLRSLATLPEGARPERVLLLHDGQRDGWPDDRLDTLPVEHAVLPELAYDQPGAKAAPEALQAAVSSTLADHGFTPDNALLHTHNHALGKSASLPGALRLLADAGWRMLLQVHDFAEDNRPENYRHLQDALGESDPDRLGAILYPQRQGIHYATLTERDAEILRTAGVPADRLHTLPNPVAEFEGMPSQEEAKSRVFPLLGLPPEARLIVYPVRGIRRKNLGEMLLLSALAPEGTYFAVTLRPKNPVEAASFDRWRQVAESLGLPCRFDTGGPTETGGYDCGFKDTLAAADAILTTSVAEGFGMVFLEAWLAGKPLLGRDLPEITREFKAAGMTFGGLYERLQAARDVGIMEVEEQIAWINSVVPEGPHAILREAMLRDNEAFFRVLEQPLTDEVATNAEVVRSRYASTAIGKLLGGVYSAIGAEHVDSEQACFSGGQIVNHFSRAGAVLPVRVETLAGVAPSNWVVFDRLRQLSGPLEPQATDETPTAAKLEGIRAVVFDVYGTLLVSGSGDISLASEGARGAAALDALRAVLHEPATNVAGSWPSGDAIVAALHAAIRAAHAASPSDHPEVEIRDIWREVLDGLGVAADQNQIDRLAVEYECRVNPIWPMPGLVETLDALVDADLHLGIVSNAQFFTPLAFAPLCGHSLDWWGFEPELCVWSFEHREAKPGTFLYERCAEALATKGVSPGETLFVGNDLRNDVWPAQRVGFRAALFAGDARSLRWRRDDARLEDVRPDAVVTDLRQLLEIVL